MFLSWGCKEVRVGCCYYDVRLWSEIDDELIKRWSWNMRIEGYCCCWKIKIQKPKLGNWFENLMMQLDKLCEKIVFGCKGNPK